MQSFNQKTCPQNTLKSSQKFYYTSWLLHWLHSGPTFNHRVIAFHTVEYLQAIVTADDLKPFLIILKFPKFNHKSVPSQLQFQLHIVLRALAVSYKINIITYLLKLKKTIVHSWCFISSDSTESLEYD